MTDKRMLGRLIFFDTRLSSPDGQACVSCHDPQFGFSDPDQDIPVSGGVMPLRVGSRNAPTVTYLATAPDFAQVDPLDPLAKAGFIGGQFWDSRASNLFEQAKLPFLNALEMHNPNKYAVVHDVEKGSYADLFKKVYGKDVFYNINYAYDSIADAIVAFEKSPELNKFNSKYDLFLQGKVQLTDQEADGLALFEGKGNCFRCHVTTPNSENGPPVFTSFKFASIGVPRNPSNPFYSLIPSLNPDGYGFIDDGLGGFLRSIGAPSAVYGPQLGKMNFPTIRNIALTAPYFHNGVFSDLKTVVHFFNTRDVPGSGFAPPEAPLENISAITGNLGLTDAEEDAIVAFMETLTDDYSP